MRIGLFLALALLALGLGACSSCNPSDAPNACDAPNPNPCDTPNPNPCGNPGAYGVTPTAPSYQEGGHGWR